MIWFNRKRVLDPDAVTDTGAARERPYYERQYDTGFWDGAFKWGILMFLTGTAFGGLLVMLWGAP